MHWWNSCLFNRFTFERPLVTLEQHYRCLFWCAIQRPKSSLCLWSSSKVGVGECKQQKNRKRQPSIHSQRRSSSLITRHIDVIGCSCWQAHFISPDSQEVVQQFSDNGKNHNGCNDGASHQPSICGGKQKRTSCDSPVESCSNIWVWHLQWRRSTVRFLEFRRVNIYQPCYWSYL